MKKRIVLSAAVALVACAGASYAGSLTMGASPAGNLAANWAVAKEKVDGAVATSTTTVSNAVLAGFTYTPVSYGSGTIAQGALTIAFPSGIAVALSSNDAAICDGATVVAAFQSAGVVGGSATTNALFFNAQNAGGTGSFTNSKVYTLGNAACAAPYAGTLAVTVPVGTTTVPLTVSTFIASNPAEPTGKDTATDATFIGVQTEYSAVVTTPFSNKIDPASGFTKFLAAAVADTATVTIARNTLLDDATTTAAGDVTTVVVSTTDATGAPALTFAAPAGAACVQSVDLKTLTCTRTGLASASVGAYNLTLTVNGTSAINERTFTATSEMNFATPLMKKHLVANTTALLNQADAGNWAYQATTLYIPIVRTDGLSGSTNETFIRIFSTDTTANANGISALIYTDNGTVNIPVKCSSNGNLSIVPTMSNKGGCLILASDLLNDAKATGVFASQTGTYNFPAKLIIVANPINIYGYATQIVNGTTQRRVPLYANSAVTNDKNSKTDK